MQDKESTREQVVTGHRGTSEGVDASRWAAMRNAHPVLPTEQRTTANHTDADSESKMKPEP